MTASQDIEIVRNQERKLVFRRFDETAAFAIGSMIRDRAVAEKLALVCDVRLWDRPLFYCSMPGTTADNPDWVRRKANTVKRFGKSTYRMVLEKQFDGRLFPPERSVDQKDFALAGGGFPIAVEGTGIIGSITASGLHERDDHGVIVAAIIDYLGLEPAGLTLLSE